jgi:hypothetical protein
MVNDQKLDNPAQSLVPVFLKFFLILIVFFLGFFLQELRDNIICYALAFLIPNLTFVFLAIIKVGTTKKEVE